MWKCFINRDNNDFITLVLDWIESPYNLQVYHYGKNNIGEIIYVITEEGNNWGFFAEFRAMLAKLLYAERMGMIPIVSYGDKFLYYETDGVYGKKNAFEYYFSQKMSEDDIYKSANVVWSSLKHSHYIENEYGNEGYMVREEFIDDLSVVFRKYIFFNDATMLFLKNAVSKLLQQRKILGIHYRGTDFKKGYKGHPIMITVEQIVEEVQKCYNSKNYEAIFLATDDKSILVALQEIWGSRLLYYKDVYRGEKETSIAFSKSERKYHKYLLGREVIRDAYTLSICDGLICGVSQVSIVAQIMKKSYDEKYEDLVVISNGVSNSGVQFI